MDKTTEEPLTKHLVLIGGGHSHLEVLRQFSLNPLPSVKLTLISDEINTPYSGMIPGLIAGHYTPEQAHIDLSPLAVCANATFVVGQVTRIDPTGQLIYVANRPPIAYDLVSLNIGSTPEMSAVGANEYSIPVKPVSRLMQGIQQIKQELSHHQNNKPYKIALVGGGVSSVEVALALQYQLQQMFPSSNLQLEIFSADSTLLASHNRHVRQAIVKILKKRDITVQLNTEITTLADSMLKSSDNREFNADKILWATKASAPSWLAEAGVAVNNSGFVAITEFLQSESHPQIFAAGDIASSQKYPRPKSGVFAVRQGPVLAENLRRALLKKPLLPYQPQKQFLSLIGLGDASAIASRGPLFAKGKWVWRWKQHIDVKFMTMYNNFDNNSPSKYESFGFHHSTSMPKKSVDNLHGDASSILPAMRCGGCGAKVSNEILQNVLHRLPITANNSILVGLDTPDDASVLKIPENKLLVQSVDYFRSFLPDNYLFGKITANHALGDLYAMGATPQTALAIATIPFAKPAIAEEILFQLLSGANDVLTECNASLSGGHTSEGLELSFGLTVNGIIDPNQLMTKGGLKIGDQLILTKPLGTGTLFAANMQLKAKGSWILAAIDQMIQSSFSASTCFLNYGCRSCTDITGFGLAGHLIEMLRASPDTCVQLNLDAMPILDGAIETSQRGINSTLYPSNFSGAIASISASSTNHPVWPLLFDPQTAGGLLAAVSKNQTQDCLGALHQLGYRHAVVIGEVVELPGDNQGKRIFI